MFCKVNKNAPVQRSPSANGYIYAQRWNSAFARLILADS